MRKPDFPQYEYDDELLQATRADGKTRVRVYTVPGQIVVLGSGSKPELEIDEDACHRDNIPILRRRGGGCAVLLDAGNVIVSLAASGLPFGHHQRHFDTITNWLIDGLERLGIFGVTQSGICDYTLNDRKVGGACLHRMKDLLYYSTTLLVSPDMQAISTYLRHPPREPNYRNGRSHHEFLGSLESHMERARSLGFIEPGESACDSPEKKTQLLADQLGNVLAPLPDHALRKPHSNTLLLGAPWARRSA